MRRPSSLFLLIGLALVFAVAPGPVRAEGSAAAESVVPPTLELPPPPWYTDELHQRVLAAGTKGVDVRLNRKDVMNISCLGASPPAARTDGVSVLAVAAGGCMVSPHGCTMNFIFTDGADNYIGTAGHCVQGGGKVVMQVGTRVDTTDTLIVTLATIGHVVKRANRGIGSDFALVKIDRDWKVVPGVAGAMGPTGVFCGDPVGQPVMHYGHGYIFAVEQGYPKAGEVIPDLSLVLKGDWENGYNWVGYGLPGDSGSPVMNAAGLAVGNLTHGLGIAGVPVPGLNFGTTSSGIFEIIGKGYSLVTVDGRSVNCNNGEILDL